VIKIKTDCLKLAELRIKHGMLPTDLARGVGVTRQAIYAIENGSKNPTPALANKIAGILEAEFDDIFSIVEGLEGR